MSLTLGIDLGTSKVAAVLLESDGNPRTSNILATTSEPTHAGVSTTGANDSSYSEQSVLRILAAVDSCISRLPTSLRAEVQAIGVTGQMHGVLLWSTQQSQTSNLINWQDKRASSSGFLAGLQERCEDKGLRDGYGAVTLAWLAAHDAAILQTFNRASTIHDFLVARCCGLSGAVTDATDAASWGMFRIIERAWDAAKIERARIPNGLLPKIQESGSVAGLLTPVQAEVWGLPSNVPVTVAIGDNQASLLATLEDSNTDVALTLGTGGQLSIPLKDPIREDLLYGETYEIRPYVDGRSIAVAASLCGGRAVAWLAESLKQLADQLSQGSVPLDRVYSMLDHATQALGATQEQGPTKEQGGQKHSSAQLSICSSFLGERFDTARRGSIAGIELNNFNLGNLGQALMRDVIENLRAMLPDELWVGKTRVMGSGNGLRKLKSMQQIAATVLGLPLVLAQEREEAAAGAAILASRAIGGQAAATARA